MQIQFKKRIKAFFADPVKQLAALMPDLQILRGELLSVNRWTGPLISIVHFFEIVSKWHDRGLGDVIAAFERVNYGQYDEVLDELQALEAHFENAGRNVLGMNRTNRGETVTMNNVYLGNIYGLFTKPVSSWLGYKDRPKEIVKGGWSIYGVISNQAGEFMDSHIDPMIILIDGFTRIARAKAA